MNNNQFQIKSSYKPSGDQPEAIKNLICGLENKKKNKFFWG